MTDSGRLPEHGHRGAPRRAVVAPPADVTVGEDMGTLMKKGGVAVAFPPRLKERRMKRDPLPERQGVARGHDRSSGKDDDRVQTVAEGLAHELRPGELRAQSPGL